MLQSFLDHILRFAYKSLVLSLIVPFDDKLTLVEVNSQVYLIVLNSLVN